MLLDAQVPSLQKEVFVATAASPPFIHCKLNPTGDRRSKKTREVRRQLFREEGHHPQMRRDGSEIRPEMKAKRFEGEIRRDLRMRNEGYRILYRIAADVFRMYVEIQNGHAVHKNSAARFLSRMNGGGFSDFVRTRRDGKSLAEFLLSVNFPCSENPHSTVNASQLESRFPRDPDPRDVHGTRK